MSFLCHVSGRKYTFPYQRTAQSPELVLGSGTPSSSTLGPKDHRLMLLDASIEQPEKNELIRFPETIARPSADLRVKPP